jgi:hypothetical protein
MDRELIFLVSTPPPESGLEIGAPCRIKASNGPESNPLVAFATEDLGRKLIAGRKLESFCTLRSLSALAPDQAEKSRNQRILFFDRIEHINRYLEEGESFDFAQHILDFRDAERKLATAS